MSDMPARLRPADALGAGANKFGATKCPTMIGTGVCARRDRLRISSPITLRKFNHMLAIWLNFINKN
jgi:hypothetical protein